MQMIRQAQMRDLPGMYRVCLETADPGADAAGKFRNPDLLGHVYVGPYAFAALDLAWVVDDADGISGYVLGVPDTRAFERFCDTDWWPALRERYSPPGDGSRDDELIQLLHSPQRVPEQVVDIFPAHMHIDLLPRTQGHGYGRELVELVLAGLRERDVQGVHLGVWEDNTNAISFYSHLGFEPISRMGDTDYLGVML